MRRLSLFAFLFFLLSSLYAQTASQRLQKAFAAFEKDEQLKHAINSLYVVDAKTGQVVFNKDSQVGLAPASTQKIITSVTAFELLGRQYRYKSELGYSGIIEKNTLKGNLLFTGSGDPTLGSWRWRHTVDTTFFYQCADAIKKTGITRVNGNVWFSSDKFSLKAIPDGWIWQDIGNYYGAAAHFLNWKENQYDIILRSGNQVGDNVNIIEGEGAYENELTAAAKGTGDNAYVYYNGLIAGTIPINEPAFKISASTKVPAARLCADFVWYLNASGIKVEPREMFHFNNINDTGLSKDEDYNTIYTHYSPPLDSLVYWFNKKSINLYGEALIKTFAYEKQGFGSTDSGVAIVKKFWKNKGLDDEELNLYDGSGLSPLNRLTTHAQVEILKYARTKDWFPYFLKSLPEYNGMTMKSGTIRDVKGFCGYHTSKDGRDYIFSFLVNNYSGKTSSLVSKMYKVLDELK
jgi:D-alanyl-D-alanine carboxypeptidase/D-alanyl-D-alanine-endopeptidase (penicillin-binding protein 4)